MTIVLVYGVSKVHAQIVLEVSATQLSYREFIPNSEIRERESTPVGQVDSSYGRDTLDPVKVLPCWIPHLILGVIWGCVSFVDICQISYRRANSNWRS